MEERFDDEDFREYMSGMGSREELESKVPGEMVDTMWQRVSERIDEKSGTGFSQRFYRGWTGPLVYGLAAAVLILLVVSITLVGEIGRLRGRGEIMQDKLAYNEHMIDLLRMRTAKLEQSPARAPMVPGRGLLPAGEAEDVGSLHLLEFLSSMPEEATVLERGDFLSLFPGKYAMMKVEIPLRRLGIDTSDGIQAGEASSLLKSFETGRSGPVTRDRLLELWKEHGGRIRARDII